MPENLKQNRVIAIAYGSEPLDRLATGRTEKLVYVVNPESVESGAIDEFSGVGFPRDSVYCFEDDLLQSLKSAFEERRPDLIAALLAGAKHA